MKEILKQKKGITLIALVITIIVLIILAGVSITMLFSQNGLIEQAKRATNETEISSIKEILKVQSIKPIRYMNTYEVDEVTKGSNKKYLHKIGIYKEKLMYLGEEDSEESNYMKEKGFEIINMTPDEFKYYIELGVLEDAVKEKPYIGRELQTIQENFMET